MNNNKAREICDRVAFNIPYVMIIGYILEKGQAMISMITDEQIDKIEDNPAMTADFHKDLIRAAREVVLNCDQSDIIRFIKAEWCCAGEVYDPDLGQFVNDREED